jgi:hypothetical protein
MPQLRGNEPILGLNIQKILKALMICHNLEAFPQ